VTIPVCVAVVVVYFVVAPFYDLCVRVCVCVFKMIVCLCVTVVCVFNVKMMPCLCVCVCCVCVCVKKNFNGKKTTQKKIVLKL